MPKVINMIGDKYYRLEVLEFFGFDKHRGKIYRCICDCGKIVKVRGHSLVQGKSKSCGCLNSERSSQRAKLINKEKWKDHKRLTIEELNKNRNKRKKERLKTDQQLRIAELTRAKIRSALKYNMYNKRFIGELGCTVNEYRIYLESIFKDGMTWENRSDKWEIDHIKPLFEFDLTDPDQADKAFYYKNTQPIFKEDHRIKSALETKEKIL